MSREFWVLSRNVLDSTNKVQLSGPYPTRRVAKAAAREVGYHSRTSVAWIEKRVAR